MCEFISWVEKGGKIFFLTDKEIFSPHGRRVLGDCKDNDMLGHGAIRKYFGKDGALMQGGTNHEVGEFWDIKKLPHEIAKLIPEFDKHWIKMFISGAFQNDDLSYIIVCAPHKWQAKAWKQLLKQKPGNADLRHIIEHAPHKWQAKAWKQLLKQKPSNDDLSYIIVCAPDEWRVKARALLHRQ